MLNLISRKKGEEHPVLSLREKMDSLFNDFFQDFYNMSPWESPYEKSNFWPNIDVSETEKEVHVSAELPGMTEKDIEVTLENGMLTIKGEKNDKQEQKDKYYHRVERQYGSFYRSVSIPQAEAEKITATFKNGVLDVVVPKKKAESSGKKIAINRE